MKATRDPSGRFYGEASDACDAPIIFSCSQSIDRTIALDAPLQSNEKRSCGTQSSIDYSRVTNFRKFPQIPLVTKKTTLCGFKCNKVHR